MFTTALFTTVEIWKQIKCPLIGEQINKNAYIYIHVYIHGSIHTMEDDLSLKREGNGIIYNNMDEPGGPHAT